MAYERESRETTALKSLQSKRYPDSNKDFAKNMRRLNSSVDYISSYMQKMQKGIDDANQNPIEQIQSFIQDLIVIFGGGEPTGFDFGDLKYIIQALGALFGLNGPFPMSLIDAASNFFLGYVVPLPQFTDVIFDAIFAWAEELGLDEEFIDQLHELQDALEELLESVEELFEGLNGLLDVFGVTGGDYGPLGLLWDAIFGLFDGVDTSGFSNILDLVTGVMGPFIEALTDIINIINAVLDAFSGNTTDLNGILNFASMFTGFIDFMPGGTFDPIGAISSFITNALVPGGVLNNGSPLNGANIFGNILGSLITNINIGALTNARPNLFAAGNFGSLASIYDNPKWAWDSTVSRTADGTGSARTAPNGTTRGLRTIAVNVGAGQELHFETYFKTVGLVCTGTPVHFDVIKFSGTDPDNLTFIGIDVLDTSPLGSGSHDWSKLENDYTIPEGVTFIKGRLVVDATATGGLVYFDEALCQQTGLLNMGWISGLLEKFFSIFGIFGGTGVIEDMENAWNNVLSMFGISIPGDMLGSINRFTLWDNIIEWFINPLGWFANLTGGILPDSQKPAWLQTLTDTLGNWFFGSSNTNLSNSNVAESLAGIAGIGNNAQTAANTANIGVQIIAARLDAPGAVGWDEFDYANANALPGDKYASSSSGPGSGQYGPNGNGKLVWKPSGAFAREILYKRTDQPLLTNNGVVTAVWSKRVADPIFSDGYGYLMGRVYNANNNTHARARIDNNTAVIQVVNSGTVTQIGATADVQTQDGDVWEFYYGILTNAYIYWLKQNGTTVRFGSANYVEDTGHLTQLGDDYKMCGIGGRADNYLVIGQISPPELNGWTWRDQNLTAVS